MIDLTLYVMTIYGYVKRVSWEHYLLASRGGNNNPPG
jgi:hypothetical protein